MLHLPLSLWRFNHSHHWPINVIIISVCHRDNLAVSSCCYIVSTHMLFYGQHSWIMWSAFTWLVVIQSAYISCYNYGQHTYVVTMISIHKLYDQLHIFLYSQQIWVVIWSAHNYVVIWSANICCYLAASSREVSHRSICTVQLPLDTGHSPVDTGQGQLDTSQLPLDTGQLTLDTSQLTLDTSQLPLDTDQLPLDTDQLPLDTSQLVLDSGLPCGLVDTLARPARVVDCPVFIVPCTSWPVLTPQSSHPHGSCLPCVPWWHHMPHCCLQCTRAPLHIQQSNRRAPKLLSLW